MLFKNQNRYYFKGIVIQESDRYFIQSGLRKVPLQHFNLEQLSLKIGSMAFAKRSAFPFPCWKLID